MDRRALLHGAFKGVNAPRFAPHLAAYARSEQKPLIDADVRRWLAVKHLEASPTRGLLHLLTWYPEFRSLFVFRLGLAGHALRPLAAGMPTLFLHTDRERVGPGLFVQHGFATVVAARSIGANCWINQQVTIGYTDDVSCPTLEDDVTVAAGAKVLGDVTLGRGTVVGAGAVVVRDTPAMSVVAGVPARVVKMREEDDGLPRPPGSAA